MNWEKYRETGDMGQVASNYPRLSRVVDETTDITFSPKEAEALLSECLRAQNLVKKPRSIRGLDKLIRIARMAEKSKLGIYFGGSDLPRYEADDIPIG